MILFGVLASVVLATASGRLIDSLNMENVEFPSSVNTPQRPTIPDNGRADQRIKIYGGVEASEYEFPWMARVITRFRGSDGIIYEGCGGSIIADDIVLTAAHCVTDRHMHPLKTAVWVGDYLGLGAIPVDSFHIHKEFTWFVDGRVQNDIALLKLSRKVYIPPICLSARPIRFGATVTAIGRGATENHEPNPPLKKVNLKVFPCPSDNLVDAYNHLCTDSTRGDVCKGDSGGPLVIKEANGFTQVAIVSYGFGCASGKPTPNTDVYSYKDWIKTGVQELSPGSVLCIQ